MTTQPDLKIGIDIGGTFTDLVMLDPGRGTLVNEKVLTTPDDPSRGVLTGIRMILEKNGEAAHRVGHVIHGTTLVANALIERKGVRTALVTTQGFRDVLQIAREWRFDTYDLFIDPVEPLVPRALRHEVVERMGPDGDPLIALDETSVEKVGRSLARQGVEAVAICLLHAFKNDAHEIRVRDILTRYLPGRTICLSSEVMPEIGEYERTSTTIANSYVQPIFHRYLGRLVEGLRAMGIARDLLLMQSDGGTVHQATATAFPIRLVQSGPAGGAQATSLFGRLAQEANVLCFDMGGTTAKACLIEDSQPSKTTEFEVARVYRFKKGSGIPLKVPVVDMIEIGAGGGSIARISRMDLIEVGPDSAGAVPGPACYGQGGADATVTDADLVLGYLDANSFLGGEMSLDLAAAEQAVRRSIAEPLALSLVEAAWGIHETVNENMSQAATIHILEKGKRPDRFVMIPIGGAGPVHACHVARKMGMRRVVCPMGAGVASAFGFLAAPMSFELVQTSVSTLSRLDLGAMRDLFRHLEERGRALMGLAGLDENGFSIGLSASMRYVGQGYEVKVRLPDGFAGQDDPKARLAAGFEDEYQRLYGRIEPGMAIEIVSWHLVVAGPYPELDLRVAGRKADEKADDTEFARKGSRRVYDALAREFVEVPVYDRYRMFETFETRGPAIVEERESTLVVPSSSTIRCDGYRNLIVDFDVPT